LIFKPGERKPVAGFSSVTQSETKGSYKLVGSIGSNESEQVKTSGAYQIFGGMQAMGHSK
jgi:hypothetical protein